jgi:LacI family transcriptional regulator
MSASKPPKPPKLPSKLPAPISSSALIERQGEGPLERPSPALTAASAGFAPAAKANFRVKAQRAATIVDVARQAGVSIKTVSRVMNAEAAVHSLTREAVMQAVSALNYRPKLSARSLAGARSYLLGLLYYDPGNTYVTGVQSGATERCRQCGRHLVVESMDVRAHDLGQQVERMVATLRPDGMILAAPISQNTEVIAALDASQTPYVLISPGSHRSDQWVVGMDDEQAAREVTQSLIELGHRRIGFIGGARAHMASGHRRRGFELALEQAGLAVPAKWVAEGDFSFQSGLRLGLEMLAQPDLPSAIFASNDDMALGVLAAAQRLGLDVPDQLSVAGFDDISAATLVWPELSTVRQPLDLMAAMAVDMLTSREPPEPLQRILPHTLMLRASTAPAPQARKAPGA